MTIIAKTKEYIQNNDLSGLYDFIINNQIDKHTASEIFLLLYEYTNSFKNSNTCIYAMNIAGKLIEIGVPHDKIILEKTKKNLSKMKFIGKILDLMNVHNSGKMIWGIIDISLFDKYNETKRTLNNEISEIIFSVKNIESIVFLIKNQYQIDHIIKFKDDSYQSDIDIEELKRLI